MVASNKPHPTLKSSGFTSIFDFRDATGSAPKFLLGQKIETARANGSHQALSLSLSHTQTTHTYIKINTGT